MTRRYKKRDALVRLAVVVLRFMTSLRRNGQRGELEVAALLRDLLGTAVVRNLTQAREGISLGHRTVRGWLLTLPTPQPVGWCPPSSRPACPPRT